MKTGAELFIVINELPFMTVNDMLFVIGEILFHVLYQLLETTVAFNDLDHIDLSLFIKLMF